MGEPSSSDTWKRLVIAKTNDQWVSMSNIKQEQGDDTHPAMSAGNFSLDYDQTPYGALKTKPSNQNWLTTVSITPVTNPVESLVVIIPDDKKEKSESSEERASRLAKMSAYAAQRLANETPEQRASRLKRMSEYAAKRLASETSEQRARRLARMSAYAAKRLAQETPEQRQARLSRMSAYAAKRHAMKKMSAGASITKTLRSRKQVSEATELQDQHDFASITLQKHNQT